MELKVLTPPLGEPLGLTEVKLHLRVDDTADYALINGLIMAAREWTENFLAGSLVEQTRTVSLSRWPRGAFRLPGGPVQSITSVTYEDEDGDTQTVDSSIYYLTPGGEIALDYSKVWPYVNIRGKDAITVTYLTGYPPVETVIPGEAIPETDPVEYEEDTTEIDYGGNIPQAIKQAMLLLIGTWYQQREGASDAKGFQTLPFGVKEILSPHREYPV